MLYGRHIAYKKIEDFFQKCGTCYTSRVMTLEMKVFGKIEVYDGLYNCLLCVVIVFVFQSPSHIQKKKFHDQN
jgi:hypothetical protein